jgi:hypothetical protein
MAQSKTQNEYFEECLTDGIAFHVETRVDGSEFCYAPPQNITRRQSRLLRKAGFRFVWRTIEGAPMKVYAHPVEG